MNTQTQSAPYEDGGRDGVIHLKYPASPGSSQKLGKRHRTDFPSEPSEGTKPADTLI